MYQLIDPFLLFSAKFVLGERPLRDWRAYYDTPSYNAWRGNAFEMVCICHLGQMKHALSLGAMTTVDFPWTSDNPDDRAQIDLVIERPDKVTYLCEMKFTNAPLALGPAECEGLARKVEVFKRETKTKNSVQLVVVSAAGVKRVSQEGLVARTLEGSDLFVF